MLESKKLLKEGRWVLFMDGLPQALEDYPWEVVRITKGGGRVYVQRDNQDTGGKKIIGFQTQCSLCMKRKRML